MAIKVLIIMAVFVTAVLVTGASVGGTKKKT